MTQIKYTVARLAMAAAMTCAAAGAMAQSAPTLDKIKSTGAITLGYTSRRSAFRTWMRI